MTRPLQAIILDFDGVIANSERLHMRSYQEAFKGTPLTLSEDAYFSRYLGFDDLGVMRAIAADQGVSLSQAAIDAILEEKGRQYERLASEGEMLFPGVPAFVKDAAAAVPIAIASGALTHEIDHVLDRAGLRSLFVAVIGADQTPESKPAPDPYLAAFARIQTAAGGAVDPRRTVAIEDSRWGLESARAAGLRTVAVTNTYPAAALSAHAELVVDGLGGLTLTALDELCAR